MPFLLASRARGSHPQRSGVRRRTLRVARHRQAGCRRRLRSVAFAHAFWYTVRSHIHLHYYPAALNAMLATSCTPSPSGPQGTRLRPIAHGSGSRAFTGPPEPIFTQALAGIFSLGWCWTMTKAEPGGRGGGFTAGEAFQAMRKRLGAPEAREEAAPLAPHTARADGGAVFSASWRQNGSKQSGCGGGAVREPELYGRAGV